MSVLRITPGPITTVELNRPEVRNALDDALVGELTTWAAGVVAGDATRVVVLRGAGPVFCAGADIAWMSRLATFGVEENLADARRTAQMLQAIDRLPVPVIGRIQGAAIGGGAGLIALCDVAIAAEEAVFGFPETTLGIVPAMIGPYVLRKIGLSAARELCTSGVRFDAARARTVGLVHDVVPATDLDAAVQARAEQYLHTAPSAVAATKRLLQQIAGRDPADVLALTADLLARQRASSEGQEGLRAFLDRRAPSWDSDRAVPSRDKGR